MEEAKFSWRCNNSAIVMSRVWHNLIEGVITEDVDDVSKMAGDGGTAKVIVDSLEGPTCILIFVMFLVRRD